jgi:NADH-quinone oxidoreductase subunit J
METLLWLVPALPLAAFCVIVAFLRRPQRAAGYVSILAIAASFVISVMALLPALLAARGSNVPGPDVDLVPAIGAAMLGQWILPFEIASVLLLAALIGAIVIAKEES